MQTGLKLVSPEAVDLRLHVTDPEVLAELARRAEPADRDAPRRRASRRRTHETGGRA